MKQEHQMTRAEQPLPLRTTKKELRKWSAENAPAFHELMAYYRGALAALRGELEQVGEELALHGGEDPVEEIRTALHTPEEITEHLVGGGYPLSVESISRDLTDVACLRVLCAFSSDLRRVEAALSARGKVRVLQAEDYIEAAREDGYRALRLLVELPVALDGSTRQIKVAVELLTPAMDLWLKAKERLRRSDDIPVPEQLDRELLACAGLCAELDGRMEQIRYNIEHHVITK